MGFFSDKQRVKYGRRMADLLTCILLFIAIACKKEEPVVPPVINEPVEPSVSEYTARLYPWIRPATFPNPVYDFAKNPLTYDGVLLGKTLFFDPLLSRDTTISCGFCHLPQAAFAHTDHALSHGINDQKGPRNGLGLQNLAWKTSFFWDGSIHELDALPVSPIQNPVEMGDTLGHVVKKIRTSAKYSSLFFRAFGSLDITEERLLKSLTQFLLTLVSANSKYDKYIRQEPNAQLTTQELSGLTLFRKNCAVCHAGELFTDQSFRNNGLLPNQYLKAPDFGRYNSTLLESDKNRFQVPSLRNIAVTLPYMHDGRFISLEEVLNHYATDIRENPSLDPILKKEAKIGIPLTNQEQKDIIAFLYTLTDDEFLTNRQHQPVR